MSLREVFFVSGWLKLQLQRAGGRAARPLRSCALARQLRTMGKSRRKYAESECAPQQPFNEEKLAPYAHSLLINFRIPLTALGRSSNFKCRVCSLSQLSRGLNLRSGGF